MKFIYLTVVIFLCHLGFCQDGQEFNLDALGEILCIVKTLQSEIRAIDGRLATIESQIALSSQEILVLKFDVTKEEMDARITAIDADMTELKHLVSLSQENLLLKMELTKEEILNNTCSRDQMTALEDSISPNECASGTHSCHSDALCSRTKDGYRCSCRSGFTGDGVVCTDINECLEGGDGPCGPKGDCFNSQGAFTCSCQDGYSIDEFSNCVLKCDSPSKLIDGLGCVTLVTVSYNWDDAKRHCAYLGGTLLQGIASQDHLDQLKSHFSSAVDFVWIGLRDLQWTDGSYQPIDPKSAMWTAGQPDGGRNQCGVACVDCERATLLDMFCHDNYYSLCQRREEQKKQ